MIKTKYINVSTKCWRATPLDCDHNTKLYKTLWEKFKIYYFILVWIYVSCNWSGIYTLYLCYILYVYYAYLFTLCILYILIKHYMYIKYIFTLTKWRYIHTNIYIYIYVYIYIYIYIYICMYVFMTWWVHISSESCCHQCRAKLCENCVSTKFVHQEIKVETHEILQLSRNLPAQS